ncbi:MAG: NAD(P)H-quinone oxidoreductase [Casimicrobiaceae bacterium]|nr:NAD(P)H-quinone oxidoreductase [Casimicrobiaceae bacterium]MCX8099311.1 NAD(P)H-quinone oxidoreductase [Casimicrobiaceae bacterium]MDW8312342.1 NAD(P)H-quinone oxidoreductase [Burkholderiales bacterium]
MRYVDHGPGGGAEVLRLAEGPVPEPGPRDVLVAVHWAGVNRPDVLQRSGLYPPPADASPVLGLEVAGEVVATGSAVTEWRVGDWLCALAPGGGYAEYCVVPAEHALPIPAGLSVREAACLPETTMTVWANVFMRASARAGESILIHGGASGIGSSAIQLARAFGLAPIFVTCGGARKQAYCLALGATEAIDYRTSDFAAIVRERTGGRGVNIVLDMVGAPYVQRNLESLATEGRLVQIAFLQGAKAEVDLRPLMLKRILWSGSTLRARSRADKAEIARTVRERVWPRIEADPEALRPRIYAEFPLAQVAEAHRMMEAGEHMGKLVLRVR